MSESLEAAPFDFPADGLPKIVTEIVPGPRSLALAARLRRVESPDTTFLGADFPIFSTDGAGSLVADADGNTFLDGTSSFGVLGLGHRHPKVLAALAAQSSHLIHGMGDVHPSAAKVYLLEKIAALSPIPDTQIILGQNGSDAIEAALKTAALATGKPGVLAFHGGYHGLSYGALEPTARPFFRDAFAAQRGRFAAHLPFGCDPDVIARAIAESEIPIGAIIAEPIQGRGGIRIPPEGWLSALRRVCDSCGILLMLDEILTGWGRTGAWFACSHEGVIPDLLCVGKAMGGGMPLSACLGSAELMRRPRRQHLRPRCRRLPSWRRPGPRHRRRPCPRPSRPRSMPPPEPGRQAAARSGAPDHGARAHGGSATGTRGTCRGRSAARAPPSHRHAPRRRAAENALWQASLRRGRPRRHARAQHRIGTAWKRGPGAVPVRRSLPP